MLPRKHRLPAVGVARVHAKGSYKRGYGLMIKKLPTGLSQSRVAIVIPKKIDKRATRRNTLKRQISSFIRPHLDQIDRPVDMVITLTKNQPIEQILNELGIWLKN